MTGFTCFLMWLRKGEKARKWKARLSRDRNLFETQVDDCLGSFCQGSATFKPLESNINVKGQVYEKLISRALDVKVSEEHIGSEEGYGFIHNISSVCTTSQSRHIPHFENAKKKNRTEQNRTESNGKETLIWNRSRSLNVALERKKRAPTCSTHSIFIHKTRVINLPIHINNNKTNYFQ